MNRKLLSLKCICFQVLFFLYLNISFSQKETTYYECLGTSGGVTYEHRGDEWKGAHKTCGGPYFYAWVSHSKCQGVIYDWIKQPECPCYVKTNTYDYNSKTIKIYWKAGVPTGNEPLEVLIWNQYRTVKFLGCNDKHRKMSLLKIYKNEKFPSHKLTVNEVMSELGYTNDYVYKTNLSTDVTLSFSSDCAEQTPVPIMLDDFNCTGFENLKLRLADYKDVEITNVILSNVEGTRGSGPFGRTYTYTYTYTIQYNAYVPSDGQDFVYYFKDREMFTMDDELQINGKVDLKAFWDNSILAGNHQDQYITPSHYSCKVVYAESDEVIVDGQELRPIDPNDLDNSSVVNFASVNKLGKYNVEITPFDENTCNGTNFYKNGELYWRYEPYSFNVKVLPTCSNDNINDLVFEVRQKEGEIDDVFEKLEGLDNESYVILPNKVYQVYVKGISDFLNHYNLNFDAGNLGELRLVSSNDVTKEYIYELEVTNANIGAYTLEAVKLPMRDPCLQPNPIRIFVGGKDQKIESKCAIRLPEDLSNFHLGEDDFNHFEFNFVSETNVIVKPSDKESFVLKAGSILKVGDVLGIDRIEDADKNWIQTSSFDDYGQYVSSSVSYYDQNSSLLQTQTVDFESNMVLAKSTLYDLEGRPSIKTLPAPIYAIETDETCDDEAYESGIIPFRYKDDFVYTSKEAVFNESDIVQEAIDEDGTRVSASALYPVEGTVGGYYSESGENSLGKTDNQPTDYPYNRVVYNTDGSGEIIAVIPPGDVYANTQTFEDMHVAKSYLQKIDLTNDIISAELGTYFNLKNKLESKSLTYDLQQLAKHMYMVKHTDAIGKLTYKIFNASDRLILFLAVDANISAYNYYNSASRLTYSVSPNGVNDFKANPSIPLNEIDYDQIFYNHLGAIEKTKKFTSGVTRYFYRLDGKLRFTQNQIQHDEGKVSYINYDRMGRTLATGEFQFSDLSFDVDELKSILRELGSDGGLSTIEGHKLEELKYDYDVSLLTEDATAYMEEQEFVRRKLSLLSKYDYSEGTAQLICQTWYSYDERGRVVETLQYLDMPKKYIHIVYDYDHKGNIQQLQYNPNQDDGYFYGYVYDLDNRLKSVYSSKEYISFNDDGFIQDFSHLKHHVSYFYSATGNLKREEFHGENAQGEKAKLQGIDYSYTAEGWLKYVNKGIDINEDIGQDGISGVNVDFKKDIFGYELHYHDGDNFVNASNADFPLEIQTAPENYFENQYNGNIRGVSFYNKKISPLDNGKNYVTYGYQYDASNRLSGVLSGDFSVNTRIRRVGNGGILGLTYSTITETWNSILWNRQNELAVKNLSYDPNGNIQTIQRYENDGELKNDLYYIYNETNRNRLLSVKDEVLSNVSKEYASYDYNSMGQKIEEDRGYSSKHPDIKIEYDASGRIKKIKDLETDITLFHYYYDENGNRLGVVEYDEINKEKRYTWYAYEHSGNLISLYSGEKAEKQEELYIYGLDRLGTIIKGSYSDEEYVDKCQYEMKDHLGNVRVVFDRQLDANGEIQISYAADYYPLGMKSKEYIFGERYKYTFEGGKYKDETDKTGYHFSKGSSYDPVIGK